jgi:hypothetical protein
MAPRTYESGVAYSLRNLKFALFDLIGLIVSYGDARVVCIYKAWNNIRPWVGRHIKIWKTDDDKLFY